MSEEVDLRIGSSVPKASGRALGSAALVVALLVATAALAEPLKLATGPHGGVWYPLGGAIQTSAAGALPDHPVQVTRGDPIDNVRAIEAGRVDLALGNSITTADAVRGRKPFEAATTDVCQVANLYVVSLHVVARASSDIRSLADLKGHPLAVPRASQTSRMAVAALLAAAGIGADALPGLREVPAVEAWALLDEGAVDGVIVADGRVGPIMTAASVGAGHRLIPLPDDIIARMRAANPGFRPVTIEAGTYPDQSADLPSIGYTAHLMARCSLAEDVVEKLLWSISGGRGGLAKALGRTPLAGPRELALDIGVPRHKGAIRFLANAGRM